MRIKRSSRVGRTACEGRHVEAETEADSCGVVAVRVCGVAVEAGVWSSRGGRWQMSTDGGWCVCVCEREGVIEARK